VTAEFSAVPRPIRVLPIGDSITVGYTDNPRWTAPFEFGYRAELFEMLNNAGIPVQFVGSSREPWNGLWKVPTNSPAPDLRLLGQDCHEGYGAKATAFVAEHIEEWVRTNQPDFILLMIGINDIPAGATNAPERAKTNLQLIAERVAATSPSTHLIIAQTIPYTRPTPAILELNRFIRETLVPDCAARGMRISTVDQCRNFLAEPAGSTGDPALYSNGYNHPNAEGYRRMARTWCEEIRRLVPNRKLTRNDIPKP
jgi:lysophospholipase L1-like esterase